MLPSTISSKLSVTIPTSRSKLKSTRLGSVLSAKNVTTCLTSDTFKELFEVSDIAPSTSSR